MSEKEGVFKRWLRKLLEILNKRTTEKDTNTPEMSISDVLPGDVLLFSGEGLISEAIKFATEGGESHAAMAYNATDLVHEVPPAASTAQMSDAFKNRNISVMRVKSQRDRDQIPEALAAAKEFVEQKEPYPMSNLYLLGLILLYRRVTPSTLTTKYITIILRRVISELEEYISQRKTPGKLPMVCSQFVYQCYAYADVHLKIKNGLVLQNATQGLVDNHMLEIKPRTLLDRIAAQPNPPMGGMNLQADLQAEIDEDELIQKLMEALAEDDRAKENTDEAVTQTQEAEISLDLMHTTNEFASCVVTAMTPEREHLSTSEEALSLLRNNEAMFVTPTDLLRNCGALEQVGTIPA